MYRKLRAAITARVVKFFEKELEKDREKYQRFHNYFGVHFKEAIISQIDVAANVHFM